MPKILERVEAKKRQIEADPGEGKRNAGRAVKAIMGGIKSKEWKIYMLEYADADTPELDRLLAVDGTLGDSDLDTKRAYLVANAVCGEPTRNELTRFVDTIDNGIPSKREPSA
jgi:hypothetical protein